MTSCSVHQNHEAATPAWDAPAASSARWPRRRAYAAIALASLLLWGGILWAVL